jgi:hypothetical protein
VNSGQKVELTGEVLRVDDDTVTVGGKDDLGIYGKTQCRAARHQLMMSAGQVVLTHYRSR